MTRESRWPNFRDSLLERSVTKLGLGDGLHADQWRESNVRFMGPTVAALQAAFASGWAETRGELLTGDLFFPPVSFEDKGTVRAGLMHSLPTIGSTPDRTA